MIQRNEWCKSSRTISFLYIASLSFFISIWCEETIWGKMKSEHIKNGKKLCFQEWIDSFVLLLVLYIPQTATSYHHSTSIHMYRSNKLNAILLYFFCCFLLWVLEELIFFCQFSSGNKCAYSMNNLNYFRKLSCEV